MTAPSTAAFSSNKTGNTTADLTFTFAADGPTGIVAGSLLVAQISVNGTGVTPAFATPGSPLFVKEQESIGATGVNRPGTAVFWRIMDGTETAVTFTATPNSTLVPMVGKLIRITGHDPVTPVGHSSTTTADTSVQTVYTLNGVTAPRDECLLLSFVSSAAASIRTFTNGGGLPESYDFGVDHGANAESQCLVPETLVSAGATGTRTFTANASGFMAGVALAIQPPAPVIGGGWGEIPAF